MRKEKGRGKNENEGIRKKKKWKEGEKVKKRGVMDRTEGDRCVFEVTNDHKRRATYVEVHGSTERTVHFWR